MDGMGSSPSVTFVPAINQSPNGSMAALGNIAGGMSQTRFPSQTNYMVNPQMLATAVEEKR